MSSSQLNAVLLLVRKARRAIESGRANDAAYLLELIEAEVADAVQSDALVDQRHGTLSSA